ncbi:MAG: rRNA maturation RNase YbeY [Acholeplasmatales bacterium]|nr:rRNA maturation RNase YbeY [Acholeplasmatales bacterium]
MKVNFTNNIVITEGNHKHKLDVSKYRTLIRNIFKSINDEHIMNIIFVDSDTIREMNRDYRGIDRVTDVISFALNDSEDDYDLPEDNYELGDIFICIDKAIEQAKDYGHSVEREMGFLAVHGYLHLCGYDHMTEDEEKIMFAKQEEILERANLRRN